MSDTWLSQKEVSDTEKVSKRTFFRRFKRGEYKTYRYVESSNGGRGGKNLQIALSCLKPSAQAEYWKNNQPQMAEIEELRDSGIQEEATELHGGGEKRKEEKGKRIKDKGISVRREKEEVRIVIPGLAGWQEKIAAARYDLVMEYVKAKERAKRRKKDKGKRKQETGISVGCVAEEFVGAYNTGISYEGLYNILGTVAKATLDKWHWALQKNKWDMACLAPRYGEHRKGIRKVTTEELNQALKFALHPNQLPVAQVIRWTQRCLTKAGGLLGASEATLRRALYDWRDTHYDRWVFCREGEKALKDKVAPYLERNAWLLEVGDVLVADGHTLNFTVINPFTGKPGRATLLLFYDWKSRYPAGWHIMMQENIQCVHAALRRAILNLGKIPKYVLLDNGKAFRSKHFTGIKDFQQEGIKGLYGRLGICACFAGPYQPQAKPVERFFGTFSELERLLPSYIGTSIETQPAHLRRNERIHKKLHNPYVPTIQQTDILIRAWFEEEYSRRPHRGLDKLTPDEIWQAEKGPGVSEEGLRYLMMSETVAHIRNNGINCFGMNWYHEALYGYRKPVKIRFDVLEMECIYVYTEDGKEFICEATPMQGTHPMAKMTGNPLDMQVLQEQLKRKRRLKKGTEAQARELAHEIGPFNYPEAVKEPERKLTRAEVEQITADAQKTKVIPLNQKPEEPELFDSEIERYDFLLDKRGRGQELVHEDIVFMEEFEGSKQYEMLRSHYEELATEVHGKH